MKLYLNDASPYARLVRTVLIETGLAEQTELIYLDPWQSPDELLTVNPAAKVPVLICHDGTPLIESACIADFLIRHTGIHGLLPGEASSRLRVLGLGRAAMDCAFGGVLQGRYNTSSPLAERWLTALTGIAADLDPDYIDRLPGDDIDLADLTVAVAFEYIDFRLPDIDWRTSAPNLSAWVAKIGQRASFEATRPS